MKLFLVLIALLFLTALDCGGHIMPPSDSCFSGTFANDQFALEMNYEEGQVWATVIKPDTPTSPWEGMSFIGKITERGRAEGVLILNFPDGLIQQEVYSISLEPIPTPGVNAECNTRNSLIFPSFAYHEDRGTFNDTTLTRQP